MSEPSPVAVRKLEDADLPQFHLLRLEALRLHPEAFGVSFGEERNEGSEQTYEGPEVARLRLAVT